MCNVIKRKKLFWGSLEGIFLFLFNDTNQHGNWKLCKKKNLVYWFVLICKRISIANSTLSFETTSARRAPASSKPWYFENKIKKYKIKNKTKKRIIRLLLTHWYQML